MTKNELLSQVVQELIGELDHMARAYDDYAYGLPVFNDREMEEMSVVILNAFAKVVQKERQRCIECVISSVWPHQHVVSTCDTIWKKITGDDDG